MGVTGGMESTKNPDNSTKNNVFLSLLSLPLLLVRIQSKLTNLAQILNHSHDGNFENIKKKNSSGKTFIKTIIRK